MQLWEQTEAGPRLKATRCHQCERRSFPAASRCRNCGSVDVELILLPREGKIETFSAMADVAVGEIRLDDGTLVFGGIDLTGSLRVGLPVWFEPHGQTVRFVHHG